MLPKIKKKSNKKLFIVHSPLHVMICKRVIDISNLDINDCVFFAYYTKSNKKKLTSYLSRFGFLEHSIFYKFSQHGILNIVRAFWLKVNVSHVEDIYFSAIDNVFLHSILSFVKHESFFTFDDGTANIDLSSKYFFCGKKRAISVFFRYLLGIKYDSNYIRGNTSLHYTIYDGYENITNNVHYLPLIKNNELSNSPTCNLKTCVILLGTVFREAAISNEYENELVNKLKCFFSDNLVGTGDFFYIPHPRDVIGNFPGFKTISNENIAEDIIISLASKYNSVHVYGFSSSAQFNTLSLSNVKHMVFYSKLITNVLNSLSKKMNLNGAISITL
ncbi:glycosyltransferase family 52 [Pectobacterium carotovorum]|nr:beta-galactosamide-alpha-2,3-sialyltransferase [Pectobacterium carotovorum subsp. carotovorum]